MARDYESSITVIRQRPKRRHDGGSHGGSWKVAYADFITAMMAFFMVMWIVGMDNSIKEVIRAYFVNPVGFKQALAAGQNPLASGSSAIQRDLEDVATQAHELEKERFEQVAERIREKMQESPMLSALDARIEVLVTDAGLRIELVETGRGETFFPLGSSALTRPARAVLTLLAGELALLPNVVVLEGHTDNAQFGSQSYSNWELSAERANAARRALEEAGFDRNRIAEVRGYADRVPRVPARPNHQSNRRVSILLPFAHEAPEAADPLAGLVPPPPVGVLPHTD